MRQGILDHARTRPGPSWRCLGPKRRQGQGRGHPSSEKKICRRVWLGWPVAIHGMRICERIGEAEPSTGQVEDLIQQLGLALGLNLRVEWKILMKGGKCGDVRSALVCSLVLLPVYFASPLPPLTIITTVLTLLPRRVSSDSNVCVRTGR